MRNRKHVILYGFFVIAMLIIIWSFSGQNYENSNQLSTKLTEGAISYTKIDITENIMVYNHILRKTAHFTLYSLLGYGLSGLIKNYKGRPVILTIVLIGAICAVIDETHQYFVLGRTASIYDVVLDSCGVLNGNIIYHLIMKKLKKVSQQNK